MSAFLYITSLGDTSIVNFTPEEKWNLLFNVDCSLKIPIGDFNKNWWPLVTNIWTYWNQLNEKFSPAILQNTENQVHDKRKTF